MRFDRCKTESQIMQTPSKIAAPLAQALADKGYETLTPVQEAVLDPDLEGRDLLVSAQTGPGPRLAGLALGRNVGESSKQSQHRIFFEGSKRVR